MKELVSVFDHVEVVMEKIVFSYRYQIRDKLTKQVIADCGNDEDPAIMLAISLDEWANDLATR